MKKRAIFYIDGFNFYYGLKDATKWDNYGNYKWLNFQNLAENVIKPFPFQEVIWVKYFTAHIKGDKSKEKRQNDYLEALSLQPKIKIYYGNYQIKKSYDKTLKKHFIYPVEKRTDVNIATQILVDAFNNNYDYAYLVTGDSDLLPAVEAIRTNFPHLTLIACFAPKRTSQELKAICQGQYYIKEKILKQSLLPNSISKQDGYIIQRPSTWY